MASTTELRKTYTDAAKNLAGTKPFYAFAGAGDLAVEKLRTVPSKLREEVTVAKIKSVPDRVRTELRGSDGAVRRVTDKINEFPRDPRKLPGKLSDFADEQVRAADERLVKLADRGEKLVKRVRKDNPGKDLVERIRKVTGKVGKRRAPAKAGPTVVSAPRRTPAKAAAPADAKSTG